MRTWLQSQSSSSATIIGREVFTPCPISGFFETMVTRPSGAMETKADSSAGAPATAAEPSARTGDGMKASRASPPPARSDALSTVRRVRSVPEGSRDTAALLFQSGRNADRAADTVVARTPADVARHRRIDLLIRGPCGLAEQRARGHDLTGQTVAALHDIDLQPGLLQSRANSRAADVLDGLDLRHADAADRQLAGAPRRAIHVHGTRTAQPLPAAVLGADQPELPPQHPQQRHLRRRLDHTSLAVDIQSVLHSPPADSVRVARIYPPRHRRAKATPQPAAA